MKYWHGRPALVASPVTIPLTLLVALGFTGRAPGRAATAAVNATLNVAPVVDELTVTPQTVFVNASHSPFQVPPAELHTVDLGDAQPGQVLTGTGIRSSKGSVYEGGVRSL